MGEISTRAGKLRLFRSKKVVLKEINELDHREMMVLLLQKMSQCVLNQELPSDKKETILATRPMAIKIAQDSTPGWSGRLYGFLMSFRQYQDFD